jgi:antitoxin component YwqK of YwqJK toxin-antitoxin module
MDEILEDEELVARLDGQLFTGVAFEENGPGGVTSELTYVDGVQEGPARDWYESGQMKGLTSYHRGTQHGEEKEWHPDGSRKLGAVYEFGVLLERKEWSEDGGQTENYVLPESHPLREMIRLTKADLSK